MKKTLFLLIAVLLLSLAFAGAASATTPFGPLKWSQPIDRIAGAQHLGQPVYNGWDEPSWNIQPPQYAGIPQVADDWQCRDRLPVTDIHWWGSYVNWIHPTQPAPQPSGFWFGMYTDVPASRTNPYSHPGAPIWQYTTNAYEEVFVGYDKDPRTNEIKDSTFQYNVYLPDTNWFYQNSDLHTTYWLSIVALFPAQPQFEWGWKTRPWMWNDDAVKNATNGWNELGYPNAAGEFVSVDMAYELSTVPEPSSLLAFATGFTSLVGLAIRRRRAA